MQPAPNQSANFLISPPKQIAKVKLNLKFTRKSAALLQSDEVQPKLSVAVNFTGSTGGEMAMHPVQPPWRHAGIHDLENRCLWQTSGKPNTKTSHVAKGSLVLQRNGHMMLNR